jgi:hypothetical protein
MLAVQRLGYRISGHAQRVCDILNCDCFPHMVILPPFRPENYAICIKVKKLSKKLCENSIQQNFKNVKCFLHKCTNLHPPVVHLHIL